MYFKECFLEFRKLSYRILIFFLFYILKTSHNERLGIKLILSIFVYLHIIFGFFGVIWAQSCHKVKKFREEWAKKQNVNFCGNSETLLLQELNINGRKISCRVAAKI